MLVFQCHILLNSATVVRSGLSRNSALSFNKFAIINNYVRVEIDVIKNNYTSAFFTLGNKWRLTMIYHKESPARGRTYNANSDLLPFFSRSTENPANAPAIQYISL